MARRSKHSHLLMQPHKPRYAGIWLNCKPLTTSPRLRAQRKLPPNILRSSPPAIKSRNYKPIVMYNKENLTKIKKMNELAPELMKAFWAFDKAAVAEGAIPVKYKELIAVAVA